MINKKYWLSGVAFILALVVFFFGLFGGKKSNSEDLSACEAVNEPLDEAQKAKKALMKELGRAGGKKSAQVRKAKKEKKEESNDL